MSEATPEPGDHDIAARASVSTSPKVQGAVLMTTRKSLVARAWPCELRHREPSEREVCDSAGELVNQLGRVKNALLPFGLRLEQSIADRRDREDQWAPASTNVARHYHFDTSVGSLLVYFDAAMARGFALTGDPSERPAPEGDVHLFWRKTTLSPRQDFDTVQARAPRRSPGHRRFAPRHLRRQRRAAGGKVGRVAGIDRGSRTTHDVHRAGPPRGAGRAGRGVDRGGGRRHRPGERRPRTVAPRARADRGGGRAPGELPRDPRSLEAAATPHAGPDPHRASAPRAPAPAHAPRSRSRRPRGDPSSTAPRAARS